MLRPLSLLMVLCCSSVVHGQVPAPGAGDVPAGSFLERHLELAGYFRARFNVLENLDLNHGATPTTGATLFPVPTSGSSDALTGGNMRFRLDPTLRFGWGVSIHARIDMLDNLVFGSTPEGLPASAWAPMSGGSASQEPPRAGINSTANSLRVKRAWASVILPIGLLSVGRMGALVDWGTGFFINSGNCIDCDGGDVGDRISFVMPFGDHLFGFAFDFGASGPTSATLRADLQPFDLDRRDDVRSYALMATNFQLPSVVERYRRAGYFKLYYGVVAALRTQDYDVPAYYLTGDLQRQYNKSDVVRRGLTAFAADVWIGIRYRGLTIDLEFAAIAADIENASLLPGTELLPTVKSRQFGGVLRAEQRWSRLSLRLQLGMASGDSAPGFGIRGPLSQTSVQPGDLDGPQIRLPADMSVNNFRFNPDYRVDQILWRRIVGTVTDAFYARPSVAYSPWNGFSIDGAAIASFALNAESAPGGERPLGIEFDLQLSYQLEKGFFVSAAYGLLFPLSGFRNNRLNLDPEPAQLLHVVLAFRL